MYYWTVYTAQGMEAFLLKCNTNVNFNWEGWRKESTKQKYFHMYFQNAVPEGQRVCWELCYVQPNQVPALNRASEDALTSLAEELLNTSQLPRMPRELSFPVYLLPPRPLQWIISVKLTCTVLFHTVPASTHQDYYFSATKALIQTAHPWTNLSPEPARGSTKLDLLTYVWAHWKLLRQKGTLALGTVERYMIILNTLTSVSPIHLIIEATLKKKQLESFEKWGWERSISNMGSSICNLWPWGSGLTFLRL